MKFSIALTVLLTTILISCQETNTARLDGSSESSEVNALDSINGLIKEEPNDPNLYFERAKLHYTARDLASSLSDVGRSIKLDSTNANYYILLADLKLISKESRDSRNALLTAYQIDPTNIDVLLKLGELYMIVQDVEESFRYLNEALKIDVYNARAYQLKGFNYKYVGDTAKAVSSFQTAVEQDPNNYDSYMQLGLLYSIADHEIALDYYDNALRVRPTSLEAMYAKGLHLQMDSASRQALEVYQDMLAVKETQYDAWYNSGYIYLEQLGKYDSAAFAFSKAIEFGPKGYFQAVYNKGLSHERANELEKAEEMYREALRINPQYDLAAYGLERILDTKKS